LTTRFSPAAVAAFELVFRPWMHRRLAGVHVAGVPRDFPTDRPLLLVANHSSWWDPFLVREVQRELRPGAPLYTLMLRSELVRRPLLRRLGVVGIDGDTPSSVLAALRFLGRRLRDRPDGAVLLFPQGRIWPSGCRPLGFRPGVELFARRLDAAVLPVGLHLEPLNRIAPTAFVSIGEVLPSTASVARIEAEVEEELDRILSFLSLHGEAAPGAWPAPHDRLAAADRGVRR
jgi:1-acyl-sn-glycerol-3-phosphate acyltransferase